MNLDLFPEGLVPGEGVCGSATQLPFADETFDVVSAFDVVEHCEDDATAVAELARVLVPGGRMLLSVPAYQWAWSDHDVQAGHHRRYTRPRLTRLVEGCRDAGAAGDVRLRWRVPDLRRRARTPPARSRARGDTRLPQVSPRTDRVLMGLCATDARVLRRHDLPFGSSVFLAAVKPG